MPTLFTQGHALLIGAGADLPNTVDDAIGLAEILQDPGRCAYPPKQVHLLTGARATRKAALDGLDALRKQAEAEATVIVYFSGHGYRVETSIGEAHFLMPNGYDLHHLSKTAISGRELAEKLAAIPAKRLLLLLDCCHAGGVGEEKAPGLELSKAPLPPEALEAFSRGKGRVLIASSREDEKSYGGRPYSAFTLALIEALCGEGASKADGVVRVADLALHTRQVVPGRTKERQHPILHFEQADNFTIAYYAGGEAQPKALPFAAPQIEPEPGAWRAQVATVVGDGVIVQGNNNTVVGAGGVMVKGNVGGDVVTGKKISQTAGDHALQIGQARDVNIYPQASGPQALPLPQALRRYLDNLIDMHQHLRLQGIRAGSQPLSIDLEKVYVSLTAVEKHTAGARPAEQPGKGAAVDLERGSGMLTIGQALQRYERLVIIGDPGCGKTTLLAYLALTYARTLRDGANLVQQRLGLDEPHHLPVLLPLRDFGAHLKTSHPDTSLDGPELLFNYLREYYNAQSIRLPEDFFAVPLEEKRSVLLLDGMDEVADPTLRQRVARIIEKFVVRYPGNRYLVTSRIVGYEGASRLGANFGLAQVRDFNAEEVRQFVYDWTRAVEVTLAGRESETILRQADQQAEHLVKAIRGNPRVAELAVNPLLLTVIALVHRYRAQLPERRSELYEEAVEVLLGQWDTAKGLDTKISLGGRELDSGDRRSLLEPVAFWMHEQKRRELEADELIELLRPAFTGMAGGDRAAAAKSVNAFVRLVNERSGLLVERGAGVYGFAHLTFQEYLAARALADREDAIPYTLERLGNPWWREVILLQAGYLGTQGRRRASELIRAIVDAKDCPEPEPCHHLLLAAECLSDVGSARVESGLLEEVQRRLQAEADQPLPERGSGEKRREAVLRKAAAMNALARVQSGQFVASFWKPPWGESEWVTVPAGEFSMGSREGEKGADAAEMSQQRVFVDEFHIAITPVTNAQYALYVADAGAQPPQHWPGGQAPRGLENHPVVYVSWLDAMAYCQWLTEKIGKAVRLPTEAEWEKAARGSQDGRAYPWRDAWAELHCNSDELGLGDTSPVGLFLNGASPYGCLDMSGNVWEWCNTKFAGYPYQPDDGREEPQGDEGRVLRGGSFYDLARYARCVCRYFNHPDSRLSYIGFRVITASLF